MDLKVGKAGFSVEGRRYNIGDVLCYPNQKIKGIVLFEFYNNGLPYDDNDRGCGFYTMTCDLIDEKWVRDETSQSSITTYFNETKENDEKIVQEVRELFADCIQKREEVPNDRIYGLYKKIMKRDPNVINEIETLEEAKEIISMMTGGGVHLHGETYQLNSKFAEQLIKQKNEKLDDLTIV